MAGDAMRAKTEGNGRRERRHRDCRVIYWIDSRATPGHFLRVKSAQGNAFRFHPMKPWLAPVIIFAGAMVLSGCVDGNLTKRDDGRYVTAATLISPNGTINAPSDRLPTSVLPVSVSKSPVSGDYTMVTAENPRQQKQQDAQDQFEEDLAALDRK
jgi:hypothetical protein